MTATDNSADFQRKIKEIIEAGHFLNQHGWVPATSSNFSARLDDGTIAITVSGFHKGHLTEEGVMCVNMRGEAVNTDLRPSAETHLHTMLYNRFSEVGAVLHSHSVAATTLSLVMGEQLLFEQYELLKAFNGVDTHDTRFVVPIFENDQDIPRLAACVEEYMDNHPPIHAFLVRGHGLYTWGTHMKEALRHIEALEFLFQCQLTMNGLRQA